MYMLIHIYINKYICTYIIDYHLGACQVHATQSCPTLCDPVDCSQPGSSVHKILQEKMLELVALPSSRGSSKPRDQPALADVFFTTSAIWEDPKTHIPL